MKRKDKMTLQATKAIGYVRVSTLDQAMEGVSLDAQRAKIQAYCQLHGLELVGIYADEGLSGKRADNRPGLQQSLAAVCKERAVLVVYSLSRLARSTRDCINIAERIEKCGADVASITEKLDTTSSMGRFFFTLMAALGQLERDQISERTSLAMAHLRRSGARISRHIPFGFDYDIKSEKLTANTREAQTLECMRGAREAGKSYQTIADELNEGRVAPKVGRMWYASSVRAVLIGAGNGKS
jgi:DNA invertase Pin-like site-specific DNA recombinase